MHYGSWVVDVQDSQQHVGNGRGYAVCSCDSSESETTDKCGFRTEDRANMAVACDEGYAVKVGLSHSRLYLSTAVACNMCQPAPLQQILRAAELSDIPRS